MSIAGLVAGRLGADGAELPIGQWLWKDSSVNQSECVPFGTGLGLEVPEDPTLRVLLKRLELCFDITASIVLHLLRPCVDEIDLSTRSDVRAIRIGTVVSCSNAVTYWLRVSPARFIIRDGKTNH